MSRGEPVFAGSRGRLYLAAAAVAVSAAVGLDARALARTTTSRFGSFGSFAACAARSTPRDRGARLLKEARRSASTVEMAFPPAPARARWCVGIVSAPGRDTLALTRRAVAAELRGVDAIAASYDVSAPRTARQNASRHRIYSWKDGEWVVRVAEAPSCAVARRGARPADVKDRSTLDYASTLEAMPLDRCDVALVVEDDVVPTKDLFRKLDAAVAAADAAGPWAYLKLFIPDKWQGFDDSTVPAFATGGAAVAAVTGGTAWAGGAAAPHAAAVGVGAAALAVAIVVDVGRPCWIRLENLLRPTPGVRRQSQQAWVPWRNHRWTNASKTPGRRHSPA